MRTPNTEYKLKKVAKIKSKPKHNTNWKFQTTVGATRWQQPNKLTRFLTFKVNHNAAACDYGIHIYGIFPFGMNALRDARRPATCWWYLLKNKQNSKTEHTRPLFFISKQFTQIKKHSIICLLRDTSLLYFFFVVVHSIFTTAWSSQHHWNMIEHHSLYATENH